MRSPSLLLVERCKKVGSGGCFPLAQSAESLLPSINPCRCSHSVTMASLYSPWPPSIVQWCSFFFSWIGSYSSASAGSRVPKKERARQCAEKLNALHPFFFTFFSNLCSTLSFLSFFSLLFFFFRYVFFFSLFFNPFFSFFKSVFLLKE